MARPILTPEKKRENLINRENQQKSFETQVIRWSEAFNRSLQDDEGFKYLMEHIKALHTEHTAELNVVKEYPIAEILKGNYTAVLARQAALELCIKDLKSIMDIPETYDKKVKEIMDIKTPKGKPGVPPGKKRRNG